jgi:hypothetical protein
MRRYCLVLGAFLLFTLVVLPFLLQDCISLFFLHLWSSNHKPTQPCCTTVQKMKNYARKTSSRCASPRSSACGVKFLFNCLDQLVL